MPSPLSKCLEVNLNSVIEEAIHSFLGDARIRAEFTHGDKFMSLLFKFQPDVANQFSHSSSFSTRDGFDILCVEGGSPVLIF